LQSPHPERCRRCGNSYEEHLELEDQAPKDIAENNDAADAGGAKASQESSRIEEDMGDPDDLDDPDNADDANDADDADDAADAGGAKASQDPQHYEEVAKDCRSVLSEPLVFSVGEMQAPLRDIPRADASIVGHLSPGSSLQGYPAHDWIKIESAAEHPEVADTWVQSMGELQPSVLPLWGAVNLQQAFEESLQLSWRALPSVEATRYALECRLSDESTYTIDIGLGKTNVLLGGLPPAATLHLRVKATVYSPMVPDGVKFEGAWAEMQCLSVGTAQELSVPAQPSTFVKCDNFKAFEDGTSTEEELCRRCGHPYSEHEGSPGEDEANVEEARPMQA